MSVTLGRSTGVKTWVNLPELTRGSSPAEPETAEALGIRPQATVLGVRWRALASEHPTVVVAGPTVAIAYHSELFYGRRSSGVHGVAATMHGRRN